MIPNKASLPGLRIMLLRDRRSLSYAGLAFRGSYIDQDEVAALDLDAAGKQLVVERTHGQNLENCLLLTSKDTIVGCIFADDGSLVLEVEYTY